MNTGAFLSYPVSTLSPPIIKNDLTSFKSQGISRIERDTVQKLNELKEQYDALLEEFKWNKIVYEAEINFEPMVGEIYHLYEIRGRNVLSMIKPDEWGYKHVGSFVLTADKHWVKKY
jgi:hypothetical protein